MQISRGNEETTFPPRQKKVTAARQKATLSVSIVVYDTGKEQLLALLESLLSALMVCSEFLVGRTEIFLVDNSEQRPLELRLCAEMEERLEALNCALRLVRGQGNVGYGCGHNLALAQTESDFTLLMNPDIRLDINSVAEGLRYLAENAGVAAVSPTAFSADGNRQFLCKRYPSVLDFLLRGFMPPAVQRVFKARLATYEMQELSGRKPGRGVPIISGCFMLCRREALCRVGGFDEAYFLYFEDFDLSVRLREHYDLVYLPAMKIIHHGGHAAGKGWHHIRLFICSAFRFFNTHGWRWL